MDKIRFELFIDGKSLGIVTLTYVETLDLVKTGRGRYKLKTNPSIVYVLKPITKGA